MKIILFVFCLLVALSHQSNTLDKNTETAIEFYKLSFKGVPQLAVARYVGDQYIQHNPTVADGKQAFITAFQQLHKQFPKKTITFERTIAQGDLVALHSHQVFDKDNEFVAMDFFRFDENGKIVEHWDSVQQIPKESKNDNTMYLKQEQKNQEQVNSQNIGNKINNKIKKFFQKSD